MIHKDKVLKPEFPVIARRSSLTDVAIRVVHNGFSRRFAPQNDKVLFNLNDMPHKGD